MRARLVREREYASEIFFEGAALFSSVFSGEVLISKQNPKRQKEKLKEGFVYAEKMYLEVEIWGCSGSFTGGGIRLARSRQGGRRADSGYGGRRPGGCPSDRARGGSG